MPSNDARTLLQAAVPTAAAGVIAAAVSAVVAGRKGAVGAVVVMLVVVLFMGIGVLGPGAHCETPSPSFPGNGPDAVRRTNSVAVHLFAAFKNTTLFNPKAFAITLVAETLVWIAAQARAHMKAKILYVEPDSRGQQARKGVIRRER